MMKKYLYKKAAPRSTDNTVRQLCAASAINAESTHRPHGFWEISFFDFGDIYVDDYIYSKLSAAVRNDIESCLQLFIKDDYGIISEDEKDTNTENKYLGDGKNLIGRYEISVGIIEIKLLADNTIISKANQ